MSLDETRPEDQGHVGKVGTLGRYRLIAELARGGMGIVYLGLVRGPGGFHKLFVVKELKDHLAEDEALVRMFLEEARLAAKLSHPNVVQTIEVGSEGTRHFLAMEHLDGQPLRHALSVSRTEGRVIPLHYFLHVLSRMLEGLHYAHSIVEFDGEPLNLVHRDVSPHNVFVTYDGQVKVLDFGIAKALGSNNNTRTGVLKGKLSYMAPEQARGEPLDRRADVFSAGVMLFEAATGTRMWSQAGNEMHILHGLVYGKVPRPRERTPDLDPTLERIILRATAVEPDDRYASAAEMQIDVDAYLRALDKPAFGPRDVGKFFADVFRDERMRLQRMVEDQLRSLRAIASGEYGKVDLAQIGSAPSVAIRAAPSASGPASGGYRVAPEAPRSVRRLAVGEVAIVQAPSAPPASMTPIAAPKRSRAIAVGAVLGVTVLAVVAFVTRVRDPGPAPSVPRSDPAVSEARPDAVEVRASTAESPPVPAAAATKDAKNASDESAPPAATSGTRHGAHPWRARPRREAPTAPPEPVPAAAAATPPAPQGAPAPKAGPRPRQQIDTRDPYAQ